MFWADRVAQEVKKRNFPLEWVDDMKTPSGRVHVGALCGVVVHDLVYKALKDLHVNTKYTYVFDNHDPMDGLPVYLSKEIYEQYMGMPLFKIPSPKKGYKNFAEYYAKDFQRTFNAIGCKPEIIWASDLYTSGRMNDGIRTVLDKTDIVRSVYEELYKKKLPNDWYPFQVYCENCEKVSTTRVYDWDGERVSYRCIVDVVDWTKGCGHEGKISPFSGKNYIAGKMPWKVEWAIKWQVIGVTVEGAGKDHMSASGSHDIASLICEKVINYKVPYPVGYEFLLIGGKKMSSSKGIGFAASDMLTILPPTLVRFLMVKKNLTQQVNFDPTEPDTIPKLFDEYQEYASDYFAKKNNDYARIFALSQIGEKIVKPPTVRFTTLAQWVQMPNMQGEIKKEGLEEWVKYAKVWVERFAPDAEKFVIQKSLPEAAKTLSEEQKDFLQKVAQELKKEWKGEEFQKALYEWAKELEISSKDAFAAIYVSLLGKSHGPKAGWLILSLDKEFVEKRLKEIYSNNTYHHSGQSNIRRLHKQELFSINDDLKKKFPSLSVGVAAIKNVHIEKTNTELEKEKLDALKSLEGLTTEQLGQNPEIVSYRKLYKATGIDWHSRRPSPEALLRRIALKRGLYTVNTCVDAYNLIVMKHRVSIGAFDYDKIAFPTMLKFTTASDEIHLLGEEQPTKFKDGEIAYFDQKGPFNMDFNYRDAKHSAVQLSTKNVYINVDGVFDIAPEKVQRVLKEACDNIIKYCGGEIEIFSVETAE